MGLELVQIQPSIPRLPRPDWLRVRLPGGENYYELKGLMRGLGLHTVCESARCPNIGEGWGHRAATFMILGGTERVASWESGLGRAGACSPGGAGDGAEVCGGHLRGPR